MPNDQPGVDSPTMSVRITDISIPLGSVFALMVKVGIAGAMLTLLGWIGVFLVRYFIEATRSTG